jgi:hypothetical protein
MSLTITEKTEVNMDTHIIKMAKARILADPRLSNMPDRAHALRIAVDEVMKEHPTAARAYTHNMMSRRAQLFREGFMPVEEVER